MSDWPASKAEVVLRALHRIGWVTRRQSGSHRTLSHPERPDYAFAFHDGEEIGPRMLARLAKHTGLRPRICRPLSPRWHRPQNSRDKTNLPRASFVASIRRFSIKVHTCSLRNCGSIATRKSRCIDTRGHPRGPPRRRLDASC
ncbi:MAG: addiction module toxin, HicA family [Acetobacteraceae bacterium]|nr:addiction module toxin, HicA family [Acetobacteraceae bacterium]